MSATYTPATLNRIATSCARMSDAEKAVVVAAILNGQPIKPVAAPKPARKATPKPAQKAAPKPVVSGLNRPATKGQIARINRAEIALGYRKSPASVLGTIADAKGIWAGLKADAAAAGIRLDAR